MGELVVVAERFNIKPLLHVLGEEGRFYVLALRPEGGTLFQGTASGMREVDLRVDAEPQGENVSALEVKGRVPDLTPFRTGRKGSRIRVAKEGDLELTKEGILKHYRAIDGRLTRVLAGERAPLIIAGVDRLLSLYGEVNSYPHRLADMIVGNPDPVSMDALHHQALALARDYFASIQKEALGRYAGMAGTGRTSETVEEIVAAAVHGRIDALFVKIGLHRWGTVVAESGACTIHEKRENGDRDLLNFAAVETLERRGTVYAVEPWRMSVSGPVAAILRY
jgi:hypothetical protein